MAKICATVEAIVSSMKIRSKEEFFDFIQEERAWRRKELTNCKSMIHGSRESHNQTVLRAGILLLYAHWEGYIKKVCEAFFSYINFKGLKYEQLKHNFLIVGFGDKFNSGLSLKRFASCAESVRFVLEDCKDKKFRIDVQSRVDTRSNLNSEVLVEMLEMLGIDAGHFISNKHHIDNRLLKYRNAIAHGERTEWNPELSVDVVGFNDLYERINDLVDVFENEVSNHVEMETYRAA